MGMLRNWFSTSKSELHDRLSELEEWVDELEDRFSTLESNRFYGDLENKIKVLESKISAFVKSVKTEAPTPVEENVKPLLVKKTKKA